MSIYHHLMIANFLRIIDKYVLSEKGQRIRRMSATCTQSADKLSIETDALQDK